VAIINLRGTSGSGKSTVVRRVMGHYGSRTPIPKTGRKQPVGYVCFSGQRRPLWIPGHYEIPCGGCDTLKSVQEVYDEVQAGLDQGYDVLFEGLMIQEAKASTFISFAKQNNILVIALTTPIEDCLRAIRERRQARGNLEPLDPKNTVDRVERVRRNLFKLQDAGVRVLRLDREAAYLKCLNELGWGAS
jgi:predicted kinase